MHRTVPVSIPADHPSLAGHFPGHPLVPGVLILDRVIAAIEAEHGTLGGLHLPQVKFVRPLLPEETATLVLEGEPPRWRFRVLHADGALVASGEVVAA